MDSNIERFIKYCKIDTQSNENSLSVPSDPKELNLTRELQKDLQKLGIPSEINEFGILYGKLPGEAGLDPIGLNSHVDTAQEVTDTNCNPRYISNYDGETIVLNDQYSMNPKEFPTLKAHIGDDLVVTDGNTLLGADDKAGLAIIMAALEHYAKHPEEKHHPICFCFTPDEEIGRGPDHFDAKTFGAAYAYTLDGGIYDEIAIENFNAAHATVEIDGVSIHPGEAKGKMVNASTLAFEFDRRLPPTKRPEYTEGHEGFNHLVSMEGACDKAVMHYIIRNHDLKKLEAQKQEFRDAAELLQEHYPTAKINVTIVDDYRNMKEVFDHDPRAVDRVKVVFQKLGITPKFNPIRGGTDGATFSFKGCPTPNLGTGSYNHHGRYEYLSVNEFNQMVRIVITILAA
ncbi:MAG: Peptidase T [Tenericutes bacterium ADurb.BinA155]|jgi:tripeptide aminopeptidase|nr:MAG: Peptidase T [Tenericutes bacterium ADurb.BinA155]